MLVQDNFILKYYKKKKVQAKKRLHSFEYVFGFSKFLNDKYDFLCFDTKAVDDEINPMGFELINACINSSNDKIKCLYEDIMKIF